MEDVLDVYHRPYDEKRPLTCTDEQPKRLVSETRVPLPPRPVTPARHDYEYRREGTVNLAMISPPLIGRRHVEVTDRRTAADFARGLGRLAEELYPDAEPLVPVTDNSNTHGPWCLYESLAPGRARRIAARVEWRYTPKHGSGLNVAEIEPATLTKQCVGRRIGSAARLRREVAAREEERNERMAAVRWRFTAADARVKLRSLYPPSQVRRSTSRPLKKAAAASVVRCSLRGRRSGWPSGPAHRTHPTRA